MKKLRWNYAGITATFFVLAFGALLSSHLPNLPLGNSGSHSGPFSISSQIEALQQFFSTIKFFPSPRSPFLQPNSEPPSPTPESIILTPTTPFESTESIKKRVSLRLPHYRESLNVLLNQLAKKPETAAGVFQSLLTISRDPSQAASTVASLPPAIQPTAQSYLKEAFKLQEDYLALDGINRDFLKPYEVVPSKDLTDYAKKVKDLEISPAVQSYIQTVSEQPNIDDQTIEKLIHLCEKRRQCVELGVVSWIDVHHVFNENQIQLIEKSVLE